MELPHRAVRALAALLVLLLMPGVWADDAALLAPTPDDLHTGIASLERRLTEADALAEAVGRLQNAWVNGGAVGRKVCTSPGALSLAAREIAFGAAWRDAAQAARAQGDRVARMAGSPTVAPLLDAPDRAQVAALQAAVARGSDLYAEASAWHVRTVAPAIARCRPALAPAAGLPREDLRAVGETRAAVAVSAVGGGRLCPSDVPADGRVVVVLDGLACYGETRCGCVPAPVLPGAVLGQ